MSAAPQELLEARALLLKHLDMHPGTPPADLDPAEVGIVGGPAHVGTDTYHCGVDTLARGSWYSAGESPRDRKPDVYAAALDVGDFSRGKANLRHFSAWLVAQCAAGASFTRDIREVIYSLDGRTVRRWDRLGLRSNGGLDHTWHTHISFFRDARGRGAVAMVRAYLIHVSILPGTDTTTSTTPQEDDDMSQQTIPVPAGFAYNERGDLLAPESAVVIGTEPAGYAPNPLVAGRRIYLSAMTDHTKTGAPVKLRVAVHDGAGYVVTTHEIKAGGRTALVIGGAAKGPTGYSITIGRITGDPSTATLPLSILVTVA
ncbi:hypothetical protein ACIA8K_07090 [Catenuloplanes sp. NPDC051500]|uniref:hypothetical protein n=1 Tax=Catenuloplanes sp. NPDC051500 TaxID=3363959 RepID=UPI0037A533B5